MPAPNINLGIGGTVTDPSGAATEGAIIKIEDKTLSESLTNETSDVNGEYAADLANLVSQWNDADVLILKAEAKGYRQTVVSAADDSVPSLEVNFDNAVTRIIMVM
jgi:hypothetical protein